MIRRPPRPSPASSTVRPVPAVALAPLTNRPPSGSPPPPLPGGSLGQYCGGTEPITLQKGLYANVLERPLALLLTSRQHSRTLKMYQARGLATLRDLSFCPDGTHRRWLPDLLTNPRLAHERASLHLDLSVLISRLPRSPCRYLGREYQQLLFHRPDIPDRGQFWTGLLTDAKFTLLEPTYLFAPSAQDNGHLRSSAHGPLAGLRNSGSITIPVHKRPPPCPPPADTPLATPPPSPSHSDDTTDLHQPGTAKAISVQHFIPFYEALELFNSRFKRRLKFFVPPTLLGTEHHPGLIGIYLNLISAEVGMKVYRSLGKETIRGILQIRVFIDLYKTEV